MAREHLAMMWDEVADLGALLHELSDDELDAPSLCDGWRVRDVYGHMLLGHTTPMASMVGLVVRYRGDMTRGSFEQSIAYASARSAEELRTAWDTAMVRDHRRIGISRVIKPTEGFLDHLIHQQDVRRPTGHGRVMPEDRLLAALELLPQVHTPMYSTKRTVAGLRLVATDVDWAHGDGPELRGPGEALVVAAGGRAVALAELTGDGVGELAARITPALAA